jgi:glutamyl-tRNA synthetase
MDHGQQTRQVTRLAPSPTGALHLGNARTFLVNWLLAREHGWHVILRVEDLDGPRVKKGADRQAMDDLRWLGIDWDEGPSYQSARAAAYERAVERLLKQGDAYACICTRREVESAASAPHADDGAAVYPGTCRGRFATRAAARIAAGRDPAVRLRVPPGLIQFKDEFKGEMTFDAARELGDFVIAKSDGTAAYQLAVVVDDAAMGVNHVVRGDDLVDSTPRQILLYRALGLADRIPAYGHLPLVVGEDGRRLAKRHGDTRLSRYREQGVPARNVLGLLARWCGITDRQPMQTAADLLGRLRMQTMSRAPIVFTAADENRLHDK